MSELPGHGQSVRIALRLKIAPNTPVGRAVPIEVTMRGTSGPSGPFSHSFRVETVIDPLPYDPEFRGLRVLQDSDSDTQIEPGETATVEVELGRMFGNGASLCSGAQASTTFPQVMYLTSESPSCSRSRHTFRLSSVMEPGTVIPFTLHLEDDLENEWDIPFQITVE